MKNKKIQISNVILNLFLIGLFSIVQVVSATEPSILDGNYHVTINGQLLTFNDSYGYPKLLAETSRVLIPIRIVTENMGYAVGWNQSTQTASITGNGNNVEISIGDTQAKVNGKQVAIDVQNGVPVATKAMLLQVPGDPNPRTYVPLRFLSETTGAQIGYENINGTHHITINTNGTVTPVTPPEPEEPYVPGQIEITGDIIFNPATDVDKYNRINEAKSLEYALAVFENISVIHKNGNYYFKYDAIPLPRYGDVAVGFGFSTSTGIALSTEPVFPENQIPINESFEILLPEGKIYPGMERISIDIAVVNRENTYDFRPGASLLSYNYYAPSDSSEYVVFGATGDVIQHVTNVDKIRLFGDLFK